MGNWSLINMLKLSRLIFHNSNPLVLSRRKPGNKHRKQRLVRSIEEVVEAPLIVKQIEKAASNKVKSVKVWDVLAKSVVVERDHLLPQHIAQVLRSFSDIGYRNKDVLDCFSDSLCDTADIKAMVSALISFQKLEFSVERLQQIFLGSLQGNTHELSFADLRFILIALGRLNIRNIPLLQEICHNTAQRAREQEKAGYAIDSREFLVFPYAVGKLQFYHDGILELTFSKIGGLVRSRIPCAPMDAAVCFEGWLRMNSESEEFKKACEKTSTYVRFVFSRTPTVKLVETGAGFSSIGIQKKEVWSLWCDEMESQRLSKLKSKAQVEALVELFEALGRETQKVRQRLVEIEREEKQKAQQETVYNANDEDSSKAAMNNETEYSHKKQTSSSIKHKNSSVSKFVENKKNLRSNNPSSAVDMRLESGNTTSWSHESALDLSSPSDHPPGGEFIREPLKAVHSYGQTAGVVNALEGEVKSFIRRPWGHAGLAKKVAMAKKNKTKDESETYSGARSS
eukprot:GDKK01043929.1.p1 GENE.GDKK01043929.1~~GDKK01043929.1.p1  ORF type:complete len:511 (-),score=72.74 GDKK01043929.1:602-2134(-)